jgi:hypothetical protein
MNTVAHPILKILRTELFLMPGYVALATPNADRGCNDDSWICLQQVAGIAAGLMPVDAGSARRNRATREFPDRHNLW